jgi:hypothetical protein
MKRVYIIFLQRNQNLLTKELFMHKYAFILLLFLLLPTQSSCMESQFPLSPKSAALKNQEIDPVNEKALNLFLKILEVKQTSRNAIIAKEKISSALGKHAASILIYIFHLAQLTNQTEVKELLKAIIEEKIIKIKNGRSLGECRSLSIKYKYYEYFELSFMENSTTFVDSPDDSEKD